MGFRTVAAVSHVFEPTAIGNESLAGGYRPLARAAFWYETGETGAPTVILNGRSAKPMNVSKINRQAIWRPGMRPEDIGALDPEGAHPINPGAADPEARLQDMDALGIDPPVL